MRLFDIFETESFFEDLEGQKAQRGQFIKDKLGPEYLSRSRGDRKAAAERLDALIDRIGSADPTRNGAYMPWMARLVITKPNQNREEDLERLGGDLANFERLKRQLDKRDINQYKSFQEVYDAIEPLLQAGEQGAGKNDKDDEAAKKKDKEAAEREIVKNESILVYQGPEGWIRIPKTKKAATILGRGTRWCTAGENNNMFSHYNKSDNLFIVRDAAQAKVYSNFMRDPDNQDAEGKIKKGLKKPDKGMYQLHIDSGQFAADDDSNKGLNAVPVWAQRPILDYYKDNNPNLTLKQIMALSRFGDENLAAGTEHEALLDLMKQYGV